MKFGYWYEGLIFIGIFLLMVGLPCWAIAALGTKLINNLGQYPSKSAKYQMDVALKLLAIEIGTFIFMAVFFRIFAS